MLKKDYFVKQLEEFGKVLGALLLLKRNKDWEQFETEIASAAKKFTPIELDYVESLDSVSFDREVISNEAISFEQKKILAAVLFEKLDYYGAACIYDKQKNAAGKCLSLYSYLYANQTDNEFSLETHYRLQFLKNFD